MITIDSSLRINAVQACFDKFVDKPYDPGRRDCVRLAGFCALNMGHRVPMLKGVKYNTEAKALRALKSAGFDTLYEAVDSLGFPRIIPAMAWPGDIVALPGNDNFGCTLAVCYDHMKVIGYQEGHDVAVRIKLNSALFAWRL